MHLRNGLLYFPPVVGGVATWYSKRASELPFVRAAHVPWSTIHVNASCYSLYESDMDRAASWLTLFHTRREVTLGGAGTLAFSQASARHQIVVGSTNVSRESASIRR